MLSNSASTSSTFEQYLNQNSTNSTNMELVKKERETIHSGHFMVSHFEAEEQDDEDKEIAMPDPDETNEGVIAIQEIIPCTEIELHSSSSVTHNKININSVIDISLSKLFKCMDLAYKQKLTSPKWNRFKGVRLRWKDKIRLNNLIWRCWHMQFIMKMKTLVCQFASPLDVDIHSKPEAVVLEGKYWKRQFNVIKAEYMKWRKFYHSKTTGIQAAIDTNSEFDILDWSPIGSERGSLMGSFDDFWTSDTLFTTINNIPFPFPDPREIAKAGLADFIQPSLGPLQPNIDDFVIGMPFQEILNSHRLPPVPEEGNEELFKTVQLDFRSIMGSDSIDQSLMQTATSEDVSTNVVPLNDDDMMDVSGNQMENMDNTINSNKNNDTNNDDSSNNTDNSSNHNDDNNNSNNDNKNKYINDNSNMDANDNNNPGNNNINQDDGDENNSKIIGNYAEGNEQSLPMDTYDNIIYPTKLQNIGKSLSLPKQMANRQFSGGGKSSSSSSLRSNIRYGKREPHNYETILSTPHQTIIYNQVIAQQSNNTTSSMYTNYSDTGSSTSSETSSNRIQSQQQHHMHESPIQTTSNNYLLRTNALNLTNQHQHLRLTNNSANSNNNNNNQNTTNNNNNNNNNNNKVKSNCPQNEQSNIMNLLPPSGNQQQLKNQHSNMTIMNLINQSTGQQSNVSGISGSVGGVSGLSCGNAAKIVGNSNNTVIGINNLPTYTSNHQNTFYKPYPTQTSYKILTQNAGYNAMSSRRIQSPPLHPQQQQQQPHVININQQNLTSGSEQNLQYQQQLQQLASMASSPPSAKEMYRSNSLPINISLQQLNQQQQIQSQQQQQQQQQQQHSPSLLVLPHQSNIEETFVVPKYSATKTTRFRTRSNSMIARQSHNLSGTGLQSAASEPMLSTLEQLLNSNNLPNQYNSSSSTALTNLTPQQTLKLPTASQTLGSAIQQTTSTPPNILLSSSPSSSTASSSSSQTSSFIRTSNLSSSPTLTASGSTQSTINSQSKLEQQQQPQTQSKYKLTKSNSDDELLIQPNSPTSPIHLSSNNNNNNNSSGSGTSLSTINKYPRETQQRRAGHIHAEQKRRCNIKNGFDTLHTLIPQLQQSSNAKLSKAAMLQKSVEYIKVIRAERENINERMKELRIERETLNSSLNHLQSVLPANGAPVQRQRTGRVRELYNDYVHRRTLENWKFWILGLIFEPLLNSFNLSVSVASMDELYRTAMLWVDQNCSLIEIRPAVSNKLRYLSTTTDILSDPPSTLRDEVMKAIAAKSTVTSTMASSTISASTSTTTSASLSSSSFTPSSSSTSSSGGSSSSASNLTFEK